MYSLVERSRLNNMAKQLTAENTLRLGEWTVWPVENTLEDHAGTKVKVDPICMRILMLMVENQGEIVSRETLTSEIWDNKYVDDQSINIAIHGLRRALKDNAGSPSYIQTVPRRGYRLVAKATRKYGPRKIRTAHILIGLLVLVFAVAAGFGLNSKSVNHSILGINLSLRSVDNQYNHLFLDAAKRLLRPTKTMIRSHYVPDSMIGFLKINLSKQGPILEIVASYEDGSADNWHATYRINADDDSQINQLMRDLYSNVKAHVDAKQIALEYGLDETSQSSVAAIIRPRIDEQATEDALVQWELIAKKYPNCAFAHACIVGTSCRLVMSGYAFDKLYTRTREAAENTIMTAQDKSIACSTLGLHYLYFEWDLERARNLFEQALHANPVDLVAQINLALLWSIDGSHEKAIHCLNGAIDQHPNDYFLMLMRVYLHLYAGNYDEALMWLYQMPNDFLSDHDRNEFIYPLAFRLQDQELIEETMTALLPEFCDIVESEGAESAAFRRWLFHQNFLAKVDASALERATHLMYAGDTKSALVQFEKAISSRDSRVLTAGNWPAFVPLRGDIEFQRLLDSRFSLPPSLPHSGFAPN